MSDVPVHYYGNDGSEVKASGKAKWWLAKEGEAHTHVFNVIKKIKQHNGHRTNNNLYFAKLYSNMDIAGLAGGMYGRTANQDILGQNKVTYNVVKSCIDTAAAKIAKTKPRPYFLTEEGSFNLQERSKNLNKFMVGQFEMVGTGWGEDRTLYGMGRQCFVDACIFGTGAIKLYINDKNEIKAERVFIDEILVDETDGRYRNPHQLHQVKLVHRDTLLEKFPKKYHGRIKACKSAMSTDDQTTADMIEVAESYHLPSYPGAKDGKKVICIENATLMEKDYTKGYFPFLFQRWSLNPLGFYGMGLAEELKGIQIAINKILRDIMVAQHLMSKPQVWLEMQSKVVAKHINNEIGGIKYYSGTPPSFMVPQAMSAEVYQHLETLYNKAYEITGISQLSAQSSKPAGLNSGVALREFQDIETERFALAGSMYEDFYIDASYMMIDMLRDLVEKGEKPEVRAQDGNFMRRLSFKDIDIPNDKSTIKAYPTNLLPTTPAGKLQKVQEMTEAGMFTQEEALDLLDYPDISKVNRMKLAPRKAVQKMVDNIVEKGVYESPEPYIDLMYARNYAQSMYCSGRSEGMPEDKMDLLRRFMDDCMALLEPDQPETQLGEPMEEVPLEQMPVDPAMVDPAMQELPLEPGVDEMAALPADLPPQELPPL